MSRLTYHDRLCVAEAWEEAANCLIEAAQDLETPQARAMYIRVARQMQAIAVRRQPASPAPSADEVGK